MTRRSGGWIVGRAALVCGVLGLVAGFVIGLVAYAPTSWAAAFEIGIPAAALGAILGLAIVGVRSIVRLGLTVVRSIVRRLGTRSG